MGKMGDTWRGVETITKTDETDQVVTGVMVADNVRLCKYSIEYQLFPATIFIYNMSTLYF